jgi:hypothetical protein
MGRLGISFSLLVCALGSAPSARALSDQCTEPLLSSGHEARSERAPQLSAATLEVVVVMPVPGDDEELPWCVSPEDPRCSPLPGHSTARELALRGFIAPSGVREAPVRSLPSRTAQPFAAAGLLPSSGVHERLERPPRS